MRENTRLKVYCGILVFLVCALVLAFIFKDYIEFKYYAWKFMRGKDVYECTEYAEKLVYNYYGERFLLRRLSHQHEDIVRAALYALDNRLSDAGEICNLVIVHALRSEIPGFREDAALALSCNLSLIKQHYANLIGIIRREKNPQDIRELGLLLNISTMGLFPFSVEDTPSEIKERALEWWETNGDHIQEKDMFSKGEKLQDK